MKLEVFMLKRFSYLLVTVFCYFLLSGCATIVNGTKQDISINSNPPQATISVTDQSGAEVYSGVTPTIVTLSRKSIHTVMFNLDGYQEQKVHISKDTLIPQPGTRSSVHRSRAKTLGLFVFAGWYIHKPSAWV